MGRRTKTLLPTTNQLLQASRSSDERAKLNERQQKQKCYCDRTAKDLKPLEKGDAVRMEPLRPGEKKWHKALVIGKHDQRSYTVETSDGGTYRCNRIHLRKTQKPPPIVQLDQGLPPTSNPKSHEPADSLETPTASAPPLKPLDKSSERKPLEFNKDPHQGLRGLHVLEGHQNV